MENNTHERLNHLDELTRKNLIEKFKSLSDPYNRQSDEYNHLQEIKKFRYLTNECGFVFYHISNFEIQCICRFLSHNKSLRILDLSNVKLTDEQLIYLVKYGLIFSSSLRHLIFNNNLISCWGISYLCSFLSKNDRITKLDVSNNLIASEGFKRIGDMLRDNNTLNYLDLSGNIQTFEDNRRLNFFLNRNQKILYFRNRFFYREEILFIKSIIQRNVSWHR